MIYYRRDEKCGLVGFVSDSSVYCRDDFTTGVSQGFGDLPQFSFRFPPVIFNSHELDGHGWRLTFKQKTSKGTMHIRLLDRTKTFGFSIKLKPRYYDSPTDVFTELGQENRINFDYMAIDGDKPRDDLSLALAEENKRILAKIGDWRPSFDRNNVIDFTEYLSERIADDSLDIEQIAI